MTKRTKFNFSNKYNTIKLISVIGIYIIYYSSISNLKH